MIIQVIQVKVIPLELGEKTKKHVMVYLRQSYTDG